MSSTASPLHGPPPHGFSVVIPIVAGIGNALLAVPMVRQLKRRRPDAKVSILARIDAMGDVFRRLSEVDETIVTGKGLKGVVGMICASRARRPDVYLVPFPSNRWQYAMLALTSGAKRKVLHAYPVGYWRAMHFIGERSAARRGIHDVEQNLNLLRALGIETEATEAPVFPLNADDRGHAASRLRESGIADRFIVLHAGSARTVLAQAKRWSPPSYATLILALQTEFPDRAIMLIEGPDEAGVADEIVASLPTTTQSNQRAHILKLNGPLAQSAALLERAELYVGSDSGLAHLAAAVRTPAVTLFAPADPDRVCPFGHRDLVVQPPTDCSPCFEYPWNATHPKMRCREPFCIHQISVESVLAKVRVALERRSAVAP